jgi:hypothetical protein
VAVALYHLARGLVGAGEHAAGHDKVRAAAEGLWVCICTYAYAYVYVCVYVRMCVYVHDKAGAAAAECLGHNTCGYFINTPWRRRRGR